MGRTIGARGLPVVCAWLDTLHRQIRNSIAVRKLRVGVVGCGLIAQVMRLPHLRELDDRYEVAAICDLSPGTLQVVGDFF